MKGKIGEEFSGIETKANLADFSLEELVDEASRFSFEGFAHRLITSLEKWSAE